MSIYHILYVNILHQLCPYLTSLMSISRILYVNIPLHACVQQMNTVQVLRDGIVASPLFHAEAT